MQKNETIEHSIVIPQALYLILGKNNALNRVRNELQLKLHKITPKFSIIDWATEKIYIDSITKGVDYKGNLVKINPHVHLRIVVNSSVKPLI